MKIYFLEIIYLSYESKCTWSYVSESMSRHQTHCDKTLLFHVTVKLSVSRVTTHTRDPTLFGSCGPGQVGPRVSLTMLVNR